MKISIAIPNYNYERYLGRTIESVLGQSYTDFEILVSDNASPDGSVEVVRGFADERIRLRVNRTNVGFAGNLDRAASLGDGELVIMLSSDDLMRPGALEAYAAFFGAAPGARGGAVVTSAMDTIDAEDAVTGRVGPDPSLWHQEDRAPELDDLAGGAVYRLEASELLRRCLLSMKNPFNFAATAYPRRLYEAVEGYGGSRMINPDKWFHWRLLQVAERAYFIDRPLFAYRWHAGNQSAQQEATGALKYLVDQYRSTLELDGEALAALGLDRQRLVDAFLEHDIVRHGLGTLARGHRERAGRIHLFGRAAYPRRLRRNPRAWALRALLMLGPVGAWLARALRRWASEPGGPGER